MSLHLIKLAAGTESLDDLRGRQDYVYSLHKCVFHTTRMMPKRLNELLDAGSLYWVIKRKIQARQVILDIEQFTDPAGIRRCNIMLERDLILTRPQPRRPFQGWRYLKGADTPADMEVGCEADDELPEALKAELTDLGLY